MLTDGAHPIKGPCGSLICVALTYPNFWRTYAHPPVLDVTFFRVCVLAYRLCSFLANFQFSEIDILSNLVSRWNRSHFASSRLLFRFCFVNSFSGRMTAVSVIHLVVTFMCSFSSVYRQQVSSPFPVLKFLIRSFHLSQGRGSGAATEFWNRPFRRRSSDELRGRGWVTRSHRGGWRPAYYS